MSNTEKKSPEKKNEAISLADATATWLEGKSEAAAFIREHVNNIRTLPAEILNTSSLRGLKDCFESIKLFIAVKTGTDLDDEDYISNFSPKLEEALKKKKVYLKGQMYQIDVPETICETHLIHIDPGVNLNQSRAPAILVTGSSGSGKSVYAVQVLPEELKKLDENIFFVYMNVDTAFGGHTLKVKKGEEAANVVGKHMLQTIKDKTDIFEAKDAKQITMYFIVDEVGSQKDKKYIGTRLKLEQIQKELNKDKTFKSVRLVLSGTGLDQITMKLNSNQDAIKIPLSPWCLEGVNKYIKKRYNGDGPEYLNDIEYLNNMIESTPVFKSLSVNPRALSYLAESLIEQQKMYGKQTINADFVVAEVSIRYINANGLAALTVMEKRWVAMIVWKALSDATYKSTNRVDLSVPIEMDPLRKSKIETGCHSLVNINLETNEGEMHLTNGQDYAITITSATSIVLFALTGNIASLCRTWEQFETVAALYELQVAYVKKYPKCPNPIKVVVSPIMFPGGNDNFALVPDVDENTILINRGKASYADVISVNRLVQAKHQEDGGTRGINLKNELSKLGVLKDDKSKLKSMHTTKFLRDLWGGNYDLDEVEHTKKLKLDDREEREPDDDEKRHGFGVNKLIQCPSKVSFPCYKYDLSKEKTENSNGEAKSEKNLEVVFVTNAERLVVAEADIMGCNLDITRSHVDNDGNLVTVDGNQHSANNYIQDRLNKNLVDNVSVKFIFLKSE